MKRKSLWILISGLIIATIIMPAVIAANEGLIGNILGPLAGDNFVNTYFKYSSFIDMIIYMVLFWGLAEWTLGAKMQGKGKMVMTGVALIMAVSLGLFEGVMGFNLVSFGPLVFTILICLLAFTIYKGLTQAGMQKRYALSICYLAAYSVIFSVIMMVTSGSFVTGPLKQVSFGLYETDNFQLIMGIAALGLIPALWLIGSWFVHKLPGMFGGGAPKMPAPGPTAPPPGGPTQPPGPEKQKQALREVGKEEQFTIKELEEVKAIGAEVKTVAENLKKAEEALPNPNDATMTLLRKFLTEAKKGIEAMRGHFKNIRRYDRRAERMAVRLKSDLHSAGVNLEAEDTIAINFCIKISKELDNSEAILDDIENDIKKGAKDSAIKDKWNDYQDAYKRLFEFHEKDLSELYKNLENLIALEEKLKKQIQGK